MIPCCPPLASRSGRRLRWSPPLLVLLAPALAAGCTDVPGLGLEALLRVEGGGAQFQTAPLPSSEAGPAVVTLNLTTSFAAPGERDKPFSGALAPEATAVVLGLEGDIGTWLLPAAAPRVEEPDYPTFDVRLSFSPEIPPGPHLLFARAADAEGRLGPAQTAPFTVAAAPPPEGALVVSLSWDTEADLDLHVLDPNGVEIWKRNINSHEPPPPGEPVDPSAWKTGALLDFDSNADCVIDGRRRENVIWKEAPPPGEYIVRVDTFSLCGEPSARWAVDVYRDGNRLTSARGTSTPHDTAGPHDRGAGMLAVSFEVP